MSQLTHHQGDHNKHCRAHVNAVHLRLSLFLHVLLRAAVGPRSWVRL